MKTLRRRSTFLLQTVDGKKQVSDIVLKTLLKPNLSQVNVSCNHSYVGPYHQGDVDVLKYSFISRCLCIHRRLKATHSDSATLIMRGDVRILYKFTGYKANQG